MEIKVGQKIWVRYNGHDTRKDNKPYEAEVVKVGRKYFEALNVGYTRPDKYELESMIQAVDSNYRNKAYLSIEEINDENERNKLSSKLKEAFRSYGTLPFTLQQLRDIDKIINPKLNH
ncbi:MAG: hypothetical protein V4547_17255 [Bacteroidota bacterium]